MKTLVLSLAMALCLLTGCNKSATVNGQQATVTLSDGSTFSGMVTSSSASSITLQAATGESRTYPMTQVASVQYNPAAPAPATETTAPGSAPSQASSAPPPAVAPAPAPPPVIFGTIPAGTRLEVRNNDTINSQTAEVGQTYPGVVEHDIAGANGSVLIPRGSGATLVVRSASGQGKLQGQSDIAVDLGSINVNGHHYVLQTSDVARRGKEGVGVNKRTGSFVGGGAALGGIIGAIAGGGKGAAIGALSGAGAGTVAQGTTRGKSVRIASETLLTFRLEAPVDIEEAQ